MQTLYRSCRAGSPKSLQKELPQNRLILMEAAMINWPEMLRYAEDWTNGFWAGAATISLIGIPGAAFVLLVRTI